jgi:hypothetical protein
MAVLVPPFTMGNCHSELKFIEAHTFCQSSAREVDYSQRIRLGLGNLRPYAMRDSVVLPSCSSVRISFFRDINQITEFRWCQIVQFNMALAPSRESASLPSFPSVRMSGFRVVNLVTEVRLSKQYHSIRLLRRLATNLLCYTVLRRNF